MKKLPKPRLALGAKLPFKGDDIMIDLETLDTKSTAVILSIGACRFNDTEIADDGFYRVVTIQSNIDEGRTISGDTLKWWITQDAKAKAVFADPNAVPLEQALEEFRAWCGPMVSNTRPWGNPARFDLGILESAYGNQPLPWQHWNEKCFRMLKKGERASKVPAPPNAGAHNALFDAIVQAQHVQAIWKEIGK